MVGVAIMSTWVFSGISCVRMSTSSTWKLFCSMLSTKAAMLLVESISPWPVIMDITGTVSMFTSSKAPARALSTLELMVEPVSWLMMNRSLTVSTVCRRSDSTSTLPVARESDSYWLMNSGLVSGSTYSMEIRGLASTSRLTRLETWLYCMPRCT